MMAIAALLATASSVNANIFAAGGITAEPGQVRPVPIVLRRHGPASSAAAASRSRSRIVLVLANFFDLSAIASIGSAVALAIFALVGVAGIRLRERDRVEPA